MDTNEQIRLERARARVEELKKFYNHLITYVVVITGLGILNYYQNQWNNTWFLWPAFGWGIGIIFNAIKAFNVNPIFNKDWEERKIRAFMEEEKQQKTERWE